ncbi:MAG: SDR family NAD(P)-dependent oxidoreductase [Inquilinaceae bacterium]
MTGFRLAVLGGCGGIGRGLVTEARARGLRVAVLDLEASIARHPPGPDVAAIAVDATDGARLADAATTVAGSLGGVDGFVNLSGFMADAAPLAETDPAVWTQVLEGNLTAAFLAARAMLPVLAAARGSMVLTGSGLGSYARPGYGPYAVAKAGIAMITKQLALEAAPSVRVNSVAPSAVDTAFLRGGTGRSDEDAATRLDIDAYAKAVPLGRIAEPRDVVGPILFLLSDDARYITGQTLHVNGGTLMP